MAGVSIRTPRRASPAKRHRRKGPLMTNERGMDAGLEEIYALIDKDRVAAAKAAQARFHGMVETGIAAIVSLEAIAGTRVRTDSRIASANVVIKAELAAARLLAEAKAQASRSANQAVAQTKHGVEAALTQIGKQTSLRLIATTREAVEMIQRDAEAAIQALKETRVMAVRDGRALAADAAEQTRREARLAAETWKQGGESARTAAACDGDDVALIVITAAEVAAVKFQDAMKASLDDINAGTDAACLAVHDAALASKMKIEEGVARALAQLQEALKTHP
jgi:hypothetical protein